MIDDATVTETEQRGFSDKWDAATEKAAIATIRKRKKAESIYSDAACTPAYISDLLPTVDFDPCSNPRSIIKARWSWSLEKGYDGKKMPWIGEGFVNWPYASPIAWAEKSQREMRNGNCTGLIVLCKLDTSTDWWHEITEPALGQLDRWELNGRVQFDEHPEIVAQRAREWELERLDAGKALTRKSGAPLKGALGESSTNFCSVILHHRRPGDLPIDLRAIATLWRQCDGAFEHFRVIE